MRLARCARYGVPAAPGYRASRDCVAVDSDPSGASRVCRCERVSDPTLPFFVSRPEQDRDEFFCGCAGWD